MNKEFNVIPARNVQLLYSVCSERSSEGGKVHLTNLILVRDTMRERNKPLEHQFSHDRNQKKKKKNDAGVYLGLAGHRHFNSPVKQQQHQMCVNLQLEVILGVMECSAARLFPRLS